MKNKKGFTLVEVIVSCVIITIVILNVAAFFLFAWKLKVQFEEDRAVLGILTSYIEAKKAQVVGTAIDRGYDYGEPVSNTCFPFSAKGEFANWKEHCINIWNYKAKDKDKVYPPLVYPLPSATNENNKSIEIKYQWCRIEIKRVFDISDDARPLCFLMPSVYVWCEAPNSRKPIGMQVTNSMPWRNYNNGTADNF